MSIDQYASAFNKYLLNFMEEIIKLFPNDKDFKVARSSINMMNMVNEKTMINLFKSYIKKIANNRQGFEEKIENGQFGELIETNYSQEVMNFAQEDQESVFEVIKKLKGYWKEIDDDTRNKISKYIQGLYKLSMKV